MNCVVTAGPTFEPLDQARRLTNFSTGRLGSELASFLSAHGHAVTLLLGRQSTWGGERRAAEVRTFTTTADLRDSLAAMSAAAVEAVFHAAAVSDFAFGKVYRREAGGNLAEVTSGKFSTREGTLLAELVPTPKIIAQLRGWFPRAQIVGWKYEVDGGRDEAIRAASHQIAECRTDACVVNGPAYGAGFGLISVGAASCRHLESREALFGVLESLVRPGSPPHR